MQSYITPKARKGLVSGIHGCGLFAVAPILTAEVIAVKAGAVLTLEQLNAVGLGDHAALQVDDDRYIAPSSAAEYTPSMIFINHSCNPNVGMRDERTFVAMRDVGAGEELVIDYAMIDSHGDQMTCTCRSQQCRRIVTGRDWQKTQLQKQYAGFFSPYIQRYIGGGARRSAQ